MDSYKVMSKTNVGALFAAIAFLHIGHELLASKETVVETKYGKLRGFPSTSREGKTYYEFRGIPYARPPIGKLRFEPPRPPKKWDGIRSASYYGSECLQVQIFIDKFLGDEDCLYLNVNTAHPKIGQLSQEASSTLLPVLVFIHGGLFMLGSGNDYKPDYFMDENIVIVTINYRLSSFGFLNTGDGVVRGNMGLKDQTLALKWVRDNIRNFGGDPNKVTLMGESAGAASVHLHMLSPMSKDLFHRAISMSGTALNHWTITKNPREQALRLGRRLNCPTNSTKSLVRCLKTLDAHVINKNHGELMNTLLRDREAAFSPTIEFVQDSNSFLNEDPLKMLSSGNISTKVPWLAGVNSEEGLIYTIGVMRIPGVTEMMTLNYTHWFPVLFGYEALSENLRHELSHKIYKSYFGERNISMDTLEEVINLFSDSSFFVGTHVSSTEMAKHVPTYNYYYTHRGHFGTAQLFFTISGYLPKELDVVSVIVYNWVSEFIFKVKPHHYGAAHFDMIPLLYRMDYSSNVRKYYEEYPLSKSLVKLLTNFANDGKLSNLNDVPWPVARPNSPLLYMRIDNNPKVIEEPFTARLQIWKTIMNLTATRI